MSPAFGLSIKIMSASTISRRLWGGMFVAMPTAIPLEPFTRRFGNFDGRTVGSFSVPSKLSIQSTVSFSRSSSIACACDFGFTRGRGSWASSGMLLLDIQVHDFLRVFLDVLPARFDGLAHEDREEGVSGRGILDRHLFQDSSRGIHRGLPEFIRVHIAQARAAVVRHP